MSTTLALVDQLAWLRLLPGCSQNTTTAAEERRKGKCRGGANLSNNGYGVVMMMVMMIMMVMVIMMVIMLSGMLSGFAA